MLNWQLRHSLKTMTGENYPNGKTYMKKTCLFCKKGFLERKTIKETYTYKGHSFEIEQPGEFCHFCGEGILNGADLKATEKQILDFQAKIDGLLTSSEIIKVRKKLKLSQKQAAEICGSELMPLAG
jgi:HTH-type transcriptional regulator/antitoxin MqsA